MDDDKDLADALGTIGSSVDSPETPQTEEGPVSPAPPRIEIEAFVGYKNRLAADTDGSIGEMMKSYADAQPPEIREKLETDVDTFIGVWDKFAAAFPPPTAEPPPQSPPPAPRELRAPEWRRQQIEREVGRKNPVLDSTFSIGPGMMPEPGTAERVEAGKFNREVNTLRERVRGGDPEAEFELASKLFGDASKWKPGHGPERG